MTFRTLACLFLLVSGTAFGTLPCRFYHEVGELIRQINSIHASQERWPVDGMRGVRDAPYNQHFANVLDGQTFESWLQKRRDAGKSTHVADFYGSAVFLSKPELADTLSGMRLHPLPTDNCPGATRARTGRSLPAIFSSARAGSGWTAIATRAKSPPST